MWPPSIWRDGLGDHRLAVARRAVQEQRLGRVDGGTEHVVDGLGEHHPLEAVADAPPGSRARCGWTAARPTCGTGPAAPAQARRTGWRPAPRGRGRGPRRSGRRCSRRGWGRWCQRTSTSRRCWSDRSWSSTKANGRRTDVGELLAGARALHVEDLEQQVDDELGREPGGRHRLGGRRRCGPSGRARRAGGAMRNGAHRESPPRYRRSGRLPWCRSRPRVPAGSSSASRAARASGCGAPGGSRDTARPRRRPHPGTPRRAGTSCPSCGRRGRAGAAALRPAPGPRARRAPRSRSHHRSATPIRVAEDACPAPR